MSDAEFIEQEEIFRGQLEDFIRTCGEFGVDPKDRIDDLVFRALE